MTATLKPYAAATTDYLGCEYISLDIEGIEKIAAAGSQGPTDVVYLYAGSPPPPPQMAAGKFLLGDRVRKTKGSSWQGRIVGFYSTELTPIGYAVESEREPGSVQIYPEPALAKLED